MVYNPNKPAANDTLDNSQIDIQQNFETSNDVFDVNHYPFDNVTSVKGFHRKVDTISYAEIPPTNLPPVTGANVATLYGYTLPGTNTNVLQYSRPQLNGVPTPLTSLNNAAGGTAFSAGVPVPIFDFDKIKYATFRVVVQGIGSNFSKLIVEGSLVTGFPDIFILTKTVDLGTWTISRSGTVLSLSNTVNTNAIWTISFIRIEV